MDARVAVVSVVEDVGQIVVSYQKTEFVLERVLQDEMAKELASVFEAGNYRRLFEGVKPVTKMDKLVRIRVGLDNFLDV